MLCPSGSLLASPGLGRNRPLWATHPDQARPLPKRFKNWSGLLLPMACWEVEGSTPSDPLPQGAKCVRLEPRAFPRLVGLQVSSSLTISAHGGLCLEATFGRSCFLQAWVWLILNRMWIVNTVYLNNLNVQYGTQAFRSCGVQGQVL